MSNPVTCDIFCNIIDNYGDIGVCWRLARQLAHEHDVAVRLWVDDLGSLAKLCPEVDAQLAQQRCRGVEVRHWTDDVFCPLPAYRPPSPACGRGVGGEGVAKNGKISSVPARGTPLGSQPSSGDPSAVIPADLVIEAFACELPESYVAAMMNHARQPVWINLEYLSAEDWVAGCHKLPSPHPQLPLVKYFFFPGFSPQTGGLLLERDLLARRDAFQNDAAQQRSFWQSIGMTMPDKATLKVSLFGYENPELQSLFDAWTRGNQPVLCLVPEGRILPQAGQYFGDAAPSAGKVYASGNLQVRVLPFVEQERYDELLWACDCNFVRGEDSCVRAQWAGKPFIWHIYPQHDGVHLQKLRAFMALYCAGLPPGAALGLHGLWGAWNGDQGLGKAASSANSTSGLPDSGLPTFGAGSGQAWNDFWLHESILRQHAHDWAQGLSGNSLALNLLDFFRSIA